MDRKFEKNQRQVPVSNGFRWLWPPNYPSTSPDQYERAFNFGGDVIVALSNKCPGCCKLIDGNQIACPRIESKRQRPTMVVGLCLLSAVVMVDPVRSIVSASQRRTSAVEWLVIEIGRD